MSGDKSEPSDSSEEIVRELYRGIFNREPDRQYLIQHAQRLRANGVKGGLSKVIEDLLATDEYKRRASDPAQLAPKLLVNSSRVHQERLNKEFAASIPPDSLLLDVGAGRAPYRDLFAHVRYESADFEKVNKDYGETTYVCDITQGIPVEDGKYDYLLFNQTLEHINEPAKALKELYRIIAPGGTLLCTVPFFYEEHEQPYDFYRYTQFAHRYLFKQAGFEIHKMDWLEGFFGTCGYMMECIYRYAPQTVPDASPDSLWAKAFLSAFRPVALMAAGAFYKMDLKWKVVNVGFPKNYVIFAKKPTT